MRELPRTRQEQKDAILDIAKLKLTYGREQPVSFFFFKGGTCIVINSEMGISRDTLMMLAQTVVICFKPDEYITVSEALMTRVDLKDGERPEDYAAIKERALKEGPRTECLLMAEATKTTRKMHMYEIKRTNGFIEFVKTKESTEDGESAALAGDLFSLLENEITLPIKQDINTLLHPLFEKGILMTLKDYWKSAQDLLDQDKQEVIWN